MHALVLSDAFSEYKGKKNFGKGLIEGQLSHYTPGGYGEPGWKVGRVWSIHMRPYKLHRGLCWQPPDTLSVITATPLTPANSGVYFIPQIGAFGFHLSRLPAFVIKGFSRSMEKIAVTERNTRRKLSAQVLARGARVCKKSMHICTSHY